MASTSGKNRSILAGVLAPSAPVTNPPTDSTEPSSRLSSRMSGLARVTSGDVQEKTLRLVDPGRCRIWSRHNRRYDLLTVENCADLLEGLKSQNKQEFPAIVRPVHDDPNYDYEVIAGARRHWSVTYLREVEHRDIKYLIETRDLTDEQAFRLSDIENRSRNDLSDYERAVDYLHAVETYYDGLAQRMADRLEVSKSWLSRFLDLARLPEEVVSAFPSIHTIRVLHARSLKPWLDGDTGIALLAEANRLTAQQREHRERGLAPMDAPQVVKALQRAVAKPGQGAKPKVAAAPRLVTNAAGLPLFSLMKKGKKAIVLEVPLDGQALEQDLVEAFRREVALARS